MAMNEIMDRKILLEGELNRYLKLLLQYEHPERVLVFGSLATGEVHPWSDIDLVIIKNTRLPFLHRLRRIRQLLKPIVATDILVYTPDEFRQLQVERPFFQQEILQKSIVIYERKR